jgi:ATP-binding cassette subfamily B protein
MVSASPVAALWRLRPYLRPYRYQLLLMLFAAILSSGTEIVIPLIAKVVIDGAITHHERGLLLPLGLLAVGLGAAGALLSLIRRWVQGNAVAGMEQAIRNDLYEHLQRLDQAFHDEWQSGQLLSRATNDLSSIRRFAGFGLVFLFISIMTGLSRSAAPRCLPRETVTRSLLAVTWNPCSTSQGPRSGSLSRSHSSR